MELNTIEDESDQKLTSSVENSNITSEAGF